MSSYENKEQNEELEKMFYKSSLKQVVKYLNAKLPDVSDSEEQSAESVEKKRVRRRVLKKMTGMYRVKDSKKIKKAILKEMNGKLDKDIKPTRVKKSNEDNLVKNKSESKRFNKYSELKYLDKKKEKSNSKVKLKKYEKNRK